MQRGPATFDLRAVLQKYDDSRATSNNIMYSIKQLCPTRGPWAACGSVEGFLRPSLGFTCNESILHLTSSFYFDNLEFDIFDAGSLQCIDCMAVKTQLLK